MSSNIELTIIQIIIMIVLFCIIILLLRQRKAIEYERRIARYSISPLEYKDKSFADIVYDKYYKEVTKLSKILNRSKFITKKSLKYEKYLGYLPNFEVIDFISNKIIISIIYIIITIFSITLQTRVVTILELIINLTIGYYLLDIYLYYRQKYMKKVIEKQVLKAVIVMNNAFKAGKSTMQAIYIASQELAPPLNYEFKRMYNEMQYGLSIDVVFDRLSKRVDNEAIQYLASSLIILNKTGGNIIKVFSSIERTLFDNQKLNEELKNLLGLKNLNRIDLFDNSFREVFMDDVIIYTDGACSGNPGKGGWGAILIYGDIKKEISGYEELTTNNQMELTAVIEALSLLKRQCNVELWTDSNYVKSGITEWIYNWKKHNWKNSKKEIIKNLELWQKLDELNNFHNIKWNWVKGHADNEFNNRADELATTEIKQHK